MSVLASIGNAFKQGWERSGKNKNAVDEYSGNYKYTNIYKNNLNFVSFTQDGKNDRNDISNKYTDFSTTPIPYKKEDTYYENDFKIPASILTEITKNYKFIYNDYAELVLDYGMLEEGNKDVPDDKRKITYQTLNFRAAPSMFNPLYGINIVGITGNTPLNNFNDITLYNSDLGDYQYNEDLSDCSISTLVKLSNEGKMGRAMYKYADFMYCKNLGKVANNRLITLRRFPIPIGDDIWDVNRGDDTDSDGKILKINTVDIPPDTGRLVTWLDDNNKLEDILKFDYHETWTEKEAHFQDQPSKEDRPEGGILGSVVNLANPAYRKSIGTGISGAGNPILQKFAGAIPIFSASGTMSGDAEGTLARYDNNRVYEPAGTIRKTTLYNGELEFSQSFTLTFDYELRAYENINPRTAFLDLMNNIYQVTYRQGKFWGGQVWFMGAPGNKKGWQTADALINHSFQKLDDTFNMLLRGDLNIGDLLGSLANGAASLLKEAGNTAFSLMGGNGEEGAKKREETKQKLANFIKEGNVNEMLKGMLKNKLGRPALYATDSILTGNPTGLWHVTIGNPRNPIMSMGNMIIESTSFNQYGPLGIDDFPTGIKVSVTLKHAKPRDMVEIGKMYTMGRSGLGIPLGRTEMSKLINTKGKNRHLNISDLMYQTAWASTSPSITDGNISPATKKK